MIDSSASIGVSKFATLKLVASGLISLFSVETGVVRVAVVTYAQNADVNVHLGRSPHCSLLVYTLSNQKTSLEVAPTTLPSFSSAWQGTFTYDLDLLT